VRGQGRLSAARDESSWRPMGNAEVVDVASAECAGVGVVHGNPGKTSFENYLSSK